MLYTFTVLSVLAITTNAQLCDYEYSVLLTNRTYNGVKYRDAEYLVDNVTGVERGCVCRKETCMRKCCPHGQGYSLDRKGCVTLAQEFNPPVYREHKEQLGFNVTQQFHFLYNKMECLEIEYRSAVSKMVQEYYLETDGKLYTVMDDSVVSFGPDKYCADNFVTERENSTPTVQFNAIACFPIFIEEHHYALSASCMLVSCFFILLTVSVYAWLPELRSLHGAVLSTYLLCFFVSLLLLAIMKLLLLVENITQEVCTGMTLVIYFATLGAFFWLNVMCFDLWSKFRKFYSPRGCTRSTVIRFLCYCAYAFGVPTALTAVVATLEFTELALETDLHPDLRSNCFMHGKGKLIYLYLPIMLICIANLVLFILTALKIAQAKKQTQVLNRKDTQRLSLYVKLFLVSGVNWVLEVVSSFYGDLPVLWQITDAYNVLVGLIIFIIFVCKKKIFLSIRKRFSQLRSMSTSTTNTNTTSTSSRPITAAPAHANHTQENIEMKSTATIKTDVP